MGHHNVSILTPRGMLSGMFWRFKPQLGRKFMPHYRKWAVYSPHHKHGGRCFNSNPQSLKLMRLLLFKKKKNCKKKATRLIEPCFTWTVFKKVCHYIFKSFIYRVVVGVFIIKANPSLFCIVKLKDLCWIKSCASMTFHLEIQFSKV